MSLRNDEKVPGIDLPPEQCHYRDEGCDFAPSCLNCHLPVCVHDEPCGGLKLQKRRRADDVARLFASGKSVRELAVIFHVSTRTVQRDLKIALPSGCHSAPGSGEGVGPR